MVAQYHILKMTYLYKYTSMKKHVKNLVLIQLHLTFHYYWTQITCRQQ